MAKYKCHKCKKTFEPSSLFGGYIYLCPNCRRHVCNPCMDEPGVGFIRRGFCPACGFELQNENEVKD